MDVICLIFTYCETFWWFMVQGYYKYNSHEHLYFCMSISFHFFGINARSTVAQLCVKYMFSFLEAAKCFPELLYHFTFLPITGIESHFPYILAVFGVITMLYFSHTGWYIITNHTVV